MFAILEILPRNNSYKQRLLEKYTEPEISLEKLECSGSSPYYIIRVRERSDGIPWKYIEQAAGICKKKMIIPADIELPEDSLIERFVPKYFPARILCNTAYKLLRTAAIPARDAVCTVVDPEGVAAEYVPKLLSVCSTLKIVTENNEVYDKTAQEALESRGAAITVVSDISAADGSTAVIYCPNPQPHKIRCRAVLTCYNTNNSNFLAIGRIAAPKSLYIPMIENIQKFEILSAMYEHCGAEKLGGLYAKTLIHSSREIPVTDCGEFLTISQKSFERF